MSPFFVCPDSKAAAVLPAFGFSDIFSFVIEHQGEENYSPQITHPGPPTLY